MQYRELVKIDAANDENCVGAFGVTIAERDDMLVVGLLPQHGPHSSATAALEYSGIKLVYTDEVSEAYDWDKCVRVLSNVRRHGCIGFLSDMRDCRVKVSFSLWRGDEEWFHAYDLRQLDLSVDLLNWEDRKPALRTWDLSDELGVAVN